MNLSKEELIRYNRQIILPGFGTIGQLKLKASKVLIVGAGGLGVPNLQYLTGAGIGKIGIIDFDEISLTNLQRQVLFETSDVGESKAAVAACKLKQLNPETVFQVYNEQLSSSNAMEIIGGYDLVIDGSDNLPTRYLVNDACVFLGKPLLYGAIFRYEGQLSVFNQLQEDGTRGPNYRDLFPTPPPPEMVTSCSEGGVFGALAGIIGAMQANEAIKILAGLGDTLSGRLLLFDSLYFSTRILNLKINPDNPVSGINPSIFSLIDYEAFCAGPNKTLAEEASISVTQLKELMDSANPPYLLDVREVHEFSIAHINGVNIPLSELNERILELPTDQSIVVHCKSGLRSQKAIALLKQKGFNQLKNLEGGLLAWQMEIDPTLEVY
jgi:sulfur-carrier protein adenylyltransferase/sulfurtransferase